MSYQDTWRSGKVVKSGERECASRYEAMRHILDLYTRPFTVLDLGASEGYFSFRIAQDYDAVVVAVEGGKQLLPLCSGNPPIIHLQHRATSQDLHNLAACEHFDVVLALNVMHHFTDAGYASEALTKLADDVIVETPPAGDVGACGQLVIPLLEGRFQSWPVIATTPSHVSDVQRQMRWLKTTRPSISRAYVDVPSHVPLRPLSIATSHHDKNFVRDGESRPWIPGINLQTYLKMGGVWPTRDAIVSRLEQFPLPKENHGDIRPWNFILTRDGLALIDGYDDRAIYDDAEGLQLTIDAVKA